jgi:hypothetical protein
MGEPATWLEEAARIERLLDEIRAVAGPVAWLRVEELVGSLLRLHGHGLEGLLGLALATGDPGLLDHIADHAPVSGLLALHGLHPMSAEDRVRRALEHMRPEMAQRGVDLELTEIAVDVVRFRARGEAIAAQAGLLRRSAAVAAEQVGSEIDRIEIDGVTAHGVSGEIHTGAAG